jgi:hypothetical protein
VSGGASSLDFAHAGGSGAPVFLGSLFGLFRRFPRLLLTAHRSRCSLDDPICEGKAKYDDGHYTIHREERGIQPRKISWSH